MLSDRDVCIHVGLPKTATTYLQSAVFPKFEDVLLMSRPFTLQSPGFNTLQFADDTIYSEPEFRTELSSVLSQHPGKKLLISDENFCGYSLYNFVNRGLVAERLARLFPQATIMLFLRGQRDLVQSLYYQFAKLGLLAHGLDRSFISIPGQGMSWRDYRENGHASTSRPHIDFFSYMSREHFLYSKLIKLYEARFPNVKVFLYEDLVHKPVETLANIEQTVGSSLPTEVFQNATRRVNERLSDEQLDSQLIFNKLVALTGRANSRVGRYAAKVLSHIVPQAQRHTRQREYLDKVVNRDGFALDNQLVENRYHLGLTNYTAKYCL